VVAAVVDLVAVPELVDLPVAVLVEHTAAVVAV
jgi:hypothetical protein